MPYASGDDQAKVHDICSAFLLLDMVSLEDGRPLSGDFLDALPEGVLYVSPSLSDGIDPDEMPWRLVQAALWQTYANLLLIGDSDAPEFVHQARVGWRRLRGTLRLLKTITGLPRLPDMKPLQPLMDQLRELRDIDVARLEVLPHLADLLSMDAGDDLGLHELVKALDADAQARRMALRVLLQESSIGEAFWQLALWVLRLRDSHKASSALTHDPAALHDWARHEVGRIHRKFEQAQARSKDVETRHRARIWAKRLRYAIEDLEGLLDSAAKKWRKQATRAQTSLGDERDVLMAAELAEQHGAVGLASRIRRLARSC